MTVKTAPMFRTLLYSLRIRRVEYRIAELPIFLIPVFLSAKDSSVFQGLTFWEGLTCFLFMFAFGDLVNCLADRDLDAAYKPNLSEAVYGLGVRGVKLQAFFSASGATILSLHLSCLRGDWLLSPMVLIGLAIAYAYSVKPLRLKGRGLWQLVFYWLGLFTCPMLFAAHLVTSTVSAGVAAVALAYGTLQTGIILVNTAEDYPEDSEAGVKTVIVALGIRRGVALAYVLSVSGGLSLLAAMAYLSWEGRVSWPTRGALLVLVLAELLVITGIRSLKQITDNEPESQCVRAIRRSARQVPIWITSIALSTLLISVVLFLRWSGAR